jgi:hypothetical protein
MRLQVRRSLTSSTPRKATQMSDSLSLGSGPYHFFARSFFSAALSSIEWAKSSFRLRFSSLSIRSRLSSDTSVPPYLLFQLYRVASEMLSLRARSAVSCPGNDRTYRFPLIVETLVRLRLSSCIIDSAGRLCEVSHRSVRLFLASRLAPMRF